jgi:hypothetical protein
LTDEFVQPGFFLGGMDGKLFFSRITALTPCESAYNKTRNVYP